MAHDDNEASLLSLTEAAARIGRHPEALRSMIRRGRLEAVRGNDGRLLVRLTAGLQQVADRSVTEDAAATTDLAAELQTEIAELRVAVARLEAGRDAAERSR